jgi:hypothetical protein
MTFQPKRHVHSALLSFLLHVVDPVVLEAATADVGDGG